MSKFEEQVNIFDLDISEPHEKKDRKKIISERKERNKKFLYTTLKVSKILDKDCKDCPFNQGNDNRNKCIECPSYKALRELGKELEQLTDHKIHKESWCIKNSDRFDKYEERLYTYDNLQDLEKNVEVERVRDMRERHKLSEIAELLDCDYKILRSFVNKHKLNKRPDGTYYTLPK